MRAAAVGPRLVDGEGRAELSFGRMISPLAEFRQKRLVRGMERRDPAARRAIEQMTRREQWPDWVSGACLLARRADAEAVGLLDERYFMYTEDVDFCAAIRARGGKILFTPRSKSFTFAGGRPQPRLRRRVRPTAAASSPSTKNTIPGWRRFSDSICD